MSGSAMASIQMKRQNCAVRAFQAAGAVSPETARTFAELQIMESGAVKRLVTNGVLVPSVDDPTRYYFDEPALRRLNRRRLFACAVVIVVALVAVWMVKGR